MNNLTLKKNIGIFYKILKKFIFNKNILNINKKIKICRK